MGEFAWDMQRYLCSDNCEPCLIGLQQWIWSHPTSLVSMVPHQNRGYPGDAGPAFSRGGIPYPMECDPFDEQTNHHSPFNKPEICGLTGPHFWDSNGIAHLQKELVGLVASGPCGSCPSTCWSRLLQVQASPHVSRYLHRLEKNMEHVYQNSFSSQNKKHWGDKQNGGTKSPRHSSSCIFPFYLLQFWVDKHPRSMNALGNISLSGFLTFSQLKISRLGMGVICMITKPPNGENLHGPLRTGLSFLTK